MAGMLKSSGHDAVVFGNNGRRFSTVKLDHEEVPYVLTPTCLNSRLNRIGSIMLRLGHPLGFGRHPMAKHCCFWYDRGFARKIAVELKSHDVDVIHIMNSPHLLPAIRRGHPRARIALHMHCEWLTQLPRKFVESRLSEVDLMIGCSEHITTTVAAAFPEHSSKCVTVPNAAEAVTEHDDAEKESNRVLFVGRLSPEKGIHVLIEAFHKVLDLIPESRLHIVGGGGPAPYEFLVGVSDDPKVRELARFYAHHGSSDDPGFYMTELKRLAGEELGKRIVFEGPVDHDQTITHYRKAALLVNPSLSESFGISLIEAMMLKRPVVATSVGGMKYSVIPGETGLLVQAGNAGALADGIIQLLKDPALGRLMGEAGRERAKRYFSWEHSLDRLLEAYASLA
jgi:glycosyltransferase involved in cell wall biosynthesis